MIRAALEAHAISSARVWATDRSQTVGASEIGQCARKIYFLKNEMDQAKSVSRDLDEDDRWGARVRGSTYEDAFWVPAMTAAFGRRLLYAGSDQRTFVHEFLSGTPDGLLTDLNEEEQAALGITDGSTCIDLDCKTADPRTKLNEAKPEHVYQVMVQVGLIRELTNHRPTHAILSYTDASFWDEIKTFTIVFDPAVYANAKKRARDIMTAGDASDLKPEGVIAGGRECELCAFTSACGQRRADRVPSSETKVQLQPDVEGLALHARQRRDDADLAMADARATEEELRHALSRHGARKMAGVTVDGRKLSISWAAIGGRPSFDTKGLTAAAEAAGIDTSSFSKAGDPTDRLVITLNESSQAESRAS